MLREHEKITAHIQGLVALKRATVNLDVSAAEGSNCATLKEFQLAPPQLEESSRDVVCEEQL